MRPSGPRGLPTSGGIVPPRGLCLLPLSPPGAGRGRTARPGGVHAAGTGLGRTAKRPPASCRLGFRRSNPVGLAICGPPGRGDSALPAASCRLGGCASYPSPQLCGERLGEGVFSCRRCRAARRRPCRRHGVSPDGKATAGVVPARLPLIGRGWACYMRPSGPRGQRTSGGIVPPRGLCFLPLSPLCGERLGEGVFSCRRCRAARRRPCRRHRVSPDGKATAGVMPARVP